ncbi:MAG: hypothetical protein QOC70_2777 [Verrucomicrobiota bacterium]|jgi:hypothetical protein
MELRHREMLSLWRSGLFLLAASHLFGALLLVSRLQGWLMYT